MKHQNDGPRAANAGRYFSGSAWVGCLSAEQILFALPDLAGDHEFLKSRRRTMPTQSRSSFYTCFRLKPAEQKRMGQMGLLEKAEME